MARWKYRDGDDTDDLAKTAKMRPRKRSAKLKKSDADDTFELSEEKWPDIEGTFAARVVEVHKRYVFVSKEETIGNIDTTDVWLGRIARKFLTADRAERNFVAVGDRVLCRAAEDREIETSSDLPQCVVLNISPRKSKISRVDPALEDREHVLATNVEQLLIVASYLAPRIKWGLIDRYIVLAEAERIEPILIFNKKDLLEEKRATHPEFYEECADHAAYYRSLGYKVFSVQANDIDKKTKKELEEIFSGKISLLSGHSGVGKSSLVNLFNPEIIQDVEPDSDIFYKGRHTTSYASFIRLSKDGYAIDTPGVRSFLIQERDPIELSYGFLELRALMGSCAFRECRHVDEPDCAILKAVEDGKIPQWRYKNYLGIMLRNTGREGHVKTRAGRNDDFDFDIEDEGDE
jgi:ribosome biogenesis GTPase